MADAETERVRPSDEVLKEIIRRGDKSVIAKMPEEDRMRLRRVINRMKAAVKKPNRTPEQIETSKQRLKILEAENDNPAIRPEENLIKAPGHHISSIAGKVGELIAQEGGQTREEISKDIISTATGSPMAAVGNVLLRRGKQFIEGRTKIKKDNIAEYAERERARKSARPEGVDRDALKASMGRFPGTSPTLRGKLEEYRNKVLAQEEGKARQAQRQAALKKVGSFAAKAIAGHNIGAPTAEAIVVDEVIKELGKAWAQSTTETVVRGEQMIGEGRTVEVALNMLDIVPAGMAATKGIKAGVKGVTEASKLLTKGQRARSAVSKINASIAEATKDIPTVRTTNRLKGIISDKTKTVDDLAENVAKVAKTDPEAGAKGTSAMHKVVEETRKVADDLHSVGEHKLADEAVEEANRLERATDDVADAAGPAIEAEITDPTVIDPVLENVSASAKLTSQEQKRLEAAIDTLSDKFGASVVKEGIESGAIRIAEGPNGKPLPPEELQARLQAQVMELTKDTRLKPGEKTPAQLAAESDTPWIFRTKAPEGTHATRKIDPTKEAFLARAAAARKASAEKPPTPSLRGKGKFTPEQLEQQRKFAALGKSGDEPSKAARGAKKLTGKKAAAIGPKQPWEMTLDDAVDRTYPAGKDVPDAPDGATAKLNGQPAVKRGGNWHYKANADGRERWVTDPIVKKRLDHQVAVKEAVLAGKQVPDEVLADYPNLARLARRKLGSEAGEVNKALVATLAASPLGGYIGAQIAKENDQNVYVGALAGAFGTFALGAALPNIAKAVKTGQAISKAKGLGYTLTSPDKDFGEGIMRFWETVLPDRIISPTEQAWRWGAITPTLGTAGGAGLGAYANKDRGGPLAGALVGGAIGATAFGAIGAIGAGQAINKQVGVNYLRAMRKLILDAPTNAPNLAAYSLNPLHRATRERILRDGYASGYRMRAAMKAYEKATPAQQAAFKDYLQGKASIQSLPKELQEPAAHYKHAWNEIGAALTEVGLPAEKAMTELGAFDPRLYAAMRNNDDYERVLGYLADGPGGPRRLTPKVFKEMQGENLPPDVRRSLDKINKDFEIDSPNMLHNFEDLSARVETIRFARYAASHTDLSRSVDEVTAGIKSGALKQRGKNAMNMAEVESESQRFVQLPDTARYGELRGKYVDSFLAEDMVTLGEMPKQISSFMKTALTTFKRSKVPWNPATQIRNIIGAFTMTNGTGGVPIFSSYWKDGLNDFRKGTDLFKEARDAGVFGRTFIKADIVNGMARAYDSGKHPMSGLMDFMTEYGKLVTKGAHKAEDIFEAVEETNKMILYRYARNGLGKTAQEAARYALKFGYDYHNVNGIVRWSKESIFGSPFVTFAYKAVPRSLETATAFRNPKRLLSFWKYPMMTAAVNEISASQHGYLEQQNLDTSAMGRFKRVALNGLGLGIGKGSFYEDNIFQRFMPDYWGESIVLLPGKDANGQPYVFDATYYQGWGDIGELGKGPMGKELAKMGIRGYPRAGEPGHPMLTTVGAALWGRDIQTGFPISDAPTYAGQAMDKIFYVGGTFAPSWMGRGLAKTIKSFDRNPEKQSPGVAALQTFGGIGIQPFDPRTQAEKKQARLESEKRTLTASRNRLPANASQGEREEYEDAIAKKEEELKALKRDMPSKNRLLEGSKRRYERKKKTAARLAAREARRKRRQRGN